MDTEVITSERSAADMRVWKLVQLDPFGDAMIVAAINGGSARRVAQRFEDESFGGLRDWINKATCRDVTHAADTMLLRSPAWQG
jgi:hypothetical protein